MAGPGLADAHCDCHSVALMRLLQQWVYQSDRPLNMIVGHAQLTNAILYAIFFVVSLYLYVVFQKSSRVLPPCWELRNTSIL